MTGFVRSYQDFEIVAESVAADLARQNIVYAEASFSPTDFERHGLSPQGIAEAIRTGLDRIPETQVVLNCDLVRDTGPDRAAATLGAVLEVAAATDARGITIGGSEHTYPPGLFASVYREAANHGLRLTAHAGEAAGQTASLERWMNSAWKGSGTASEWLRMPTCSLASSPIRSRSRFARPPTSGPVSCRAGTVTR